MEMDKEKLKKLINNYNGLDKEEQEEINMHIDTAWDKVFEAYMTACEQDSELCDAYDQLKKIKEILSFDLSEHFTVYSHTINEFDPEARENVYVFSPKRFQESKNIAENLDKLLTELNKKLEDLRLKKIVLFREAKIKKLTEKKDSYISIANHYNSCMKRQAEKEHYIKNKAELILSYQKLQEERLAKYAKEVVDKFIISDPIIVCEKHTAQISSTAHKRDFDTSPLNKACNAVREDVMFDIKKSQGVEK